MLRFEGVFSVLPTPFFPDGRIDFESLDRVIDLFIGAGVNGLTALGVTSETARLNDSERDRVLERVIQRVAGRVSVVAGATAAGTHTCIEYSRKAAELKADAVMISPPRMPKLNSDAVVRHFNSLADAIDLPIVIQDYPVISGYAMEPSLLVRITREVPQASAIKLEDPPTPYKIARIIEQTEGMPISIMGGLGGMYLLEELMAGANGAMTGFAYPEMLLEVVREYRAGSVQKAADTFYRYVPLMRFEFQEGVGMAIRKEILRRRGVFTHAALRTPATPLDETMSRALDSLLAWMNLTTKTTENTEKNI